MKVVHMEELKRSRESRASSTRPATKKGVPPPRRRVPGKKAAAHRGKHTREVKSGRYGLLTAFVMLALLAVAVALGWNVFEVRTIAVTGAKTTDKQEIVQLSGLRLKENIFQANLSTAKQRIESDPLLEVKRIARVLPDKITIEIRERKPHGAIAYMGAFIIIDEKCIVLDERAELPTGQYPLISGIDIKPSERGKRVVGINSTDLQVLDGLLSALYDNGAISYIGQIDLKDPQNITMLTTEGLKVDIGQPEQLTEKAKWIAATVPQLRQKGMTTGTLYVTGANSPVYSAEGSGGQPADGDQDDEEGAAGDQGQAGDEGGDADQQEQNQDDNGKNDDGQNSDEQNSDEQNSGTPQNQQNNGAGGVDA